MEAQAWRKDGRLATPADFMTGNWESHTRVSSDDRGAAIQQHNDTMLEITSNQLLVLYTDGSSCEGRIGAAVDIDPGNEYRHC